VISFAPTEEQEVAATRCANSPRARSVRSRDAATKRAAPGSSSSRLATGLVATQIPRRSGVREVRSPITNALVLEELAFGDAGLALARSHRRSRDADRRVRQRGAAARIPAALLWRCVPCGVARIGRAGPCFDPMGLRTHAERKGDSYVLSGAKCFVPLADRASHFLVLARNGGDGADAVQGFIVPRDAAGLTISSPEKNSGCARSRRHADARTRRVPATARLGGDIGCDARRIVNLSRTAQAAVLVGVSRAVMEYAIPTPRTARPSTRRSRRSRRSRHAGRHVHRGRRDALLTGRLPAGWNRTRRHPRSATRADLLRRSDEDRRRRRAGARWPRLHPRAPRRTLVCNVRMLGVLDGAALV